MLFILKAHTKLDYTKKLSKILYKHINISILKQEIIHLKTFSTFSSFVDCMVKWEKTIFMGLVVGCHEKKDVEEYERKIRYTSQYRVSNGNQR